MTGLLLGLWRRAGLPEEEYVDPRFSPPWCSPSPARR